MTSSLSAPSLAQGARRRAVACALLALGLGAGPALAPRHALAAAFDDPAAREARWNDVAEAVFKGRPRQNGEGIVELEAPPRALDAALVPMSVTLTGKVPIKSVYLVIDDNPAPVAAHVSFGPAADPRRLDLRVRVNAYTNVHAVAEGEDGALYETVKFVKASGGCSAPMGMSDEEAMKGMGEIRLKMAGPPAEDGTQRATLMVRHPNFNGMQMNQVTRDYTPARYIRTISVASGDAKVFDLETDISLASNPVIGFGLKPKGEIRVNVVDSEQGRWEKGFPVAQMSH